MKKTASTLLIVALALTGCGASTEAAETPTAEPTLSISDACATYRGLVSVDEELSADLLELSDQTTGNLSDQFRILGEGLVGGLDQGGKLDEFTAAMDSVSGTCQT